MRIPERDVRRDPLVYLLTLFHRYPLKRKQFGFSVYLWKVSKQITGTQVTSRWVFSSRDEFLVITVSIKIRYTIVLL